MSKQNDSNKSLSKYCSIGGQAVIEGVMMRGPELAVLTVRHTSGELRQELIADNLKERPKVTRIKFVRGVFNFVDSLKVGYKCLMRSVDLSGFEEEAMEEDDTLSNEEKEKRKKKWDALLTVVSSVLGLALALALFIYLPTALYNLCKSMLPVLDHRVLQSVFEGILKLAIFVGYAWAISFMNDIHSVFMYHGAEHKTIFCYEKGLPLNVENVRAQSRFHPRCGTSFICLVLIISIIVGLFIPHSVPTLVRAGIKLLCLPVVMSIGYEALQLAGRKDNAFTRIISMPGIWVQRLTTKAPEDGMIECAIVSFVSVLPKDDPAVAAATVADFELYEKADTTAEANI